MIKVKGQNLWPEALDEAVFSSGVAEFEAQVELDERGREILKITVEAESTEVCEPVVRAVRAKTGLTPDVIIVPPGAVTRGIADNFIKRTRLRDRRGGRPT
jgi:phenylacetate-coenzyme A ligase PaaK-like adenylate-forming protein